MLHQCCIIKCWPPIPHENKKKKNTEMTRWTWPGGCAERRKCHAFIQQWGSGFGPVSKQKTGKVKDSFLLQHQTFQSTSRDISGVFFFLLCDERLCTVENLWTALLKMKIHKQNSKIHLQSDGLPFLHLYPQEVQLSCKSNWLILIQGTDALYGAGKNPWNSMLCKSKEIKYLILNPMLRNSWD